MPFRFNPFTDRLDVVNAASSGDAVLTVTGNSGGAVSPDGSGNINIIGSGVLSATGNSGTNTITFSSTGAIPWTVVTVNASFTANTGTIANKSGLLTMTLPASANIGDTISITGINTALGWKIAQNASQQIFFGNQSTTSGTGGSLASSATRDTVYLVCVVSGSSTVYNVVSSVGNITVV